MLIFQTVRNATDTQSPQNLTSLMSIGKNTKKVKILEKQIFRGSPTSKIWQKLLKIQFFMDFRNSFKPVSFPGHNHPQTSFKVAEFVSSHTK